VDLNKQGKTIRRQEFQVGKLKRRMYTTPQGFLASEEFFGRDGFKAEYVRYYTREGRRGTEYNRWWYEQGRPVRMTKRGEVLFDTTKERNPQETRSQSHCRVPLFERLVDLEAS
jgi:hypothetical protein